MQRVMHRSGHPPLSLIHFLPASVGWGTVVIRSLKPFFSHSPLHSNSTPLISLASSFLIRSSNSFFCFSQASFFVLSFGFGRSQLTTNGSEIPPSITATNLDGANASRAMRYWSVTFSVGSAFFLSFSCAGARAAQAMNAPASGMRKGHCRFNRNIVNLEFRDRWDDRRWSAHSKPGAGEFRQPVSSLRPRAELRPLPYRWAS